MAVEYAERYIFLHLISPVVVNFATRPLIRRSRPMQPCLTTFNLGAKDGSHLDVNAWKSISHVGSEGDNHVELVALGYGYASLQLLCTVVAISQ